MKNRSNLEIIALILEVCSGRRATRVRIMFKAYLSYLQLKEYLPLLLERGLIEYNEKDRVYSTTFRGVRFLEIYNEMSGILVHRKPL